MKKHLSTLLVSAGMVVGGLATLLVPVPVSAQTPPPADPGAGGAAGGSSGGSGINVFQNCNGAAAGTASGKQICGAQDDGEGFNRLMTNIINTILFVLGIIAVIMIIIGGIRYTTSNGDASGIKSAKDTIMYAVIGLVVAIMAYAIVNFVLARLGGN